jgi:hypothetical protein
LLQELVQAVRPDRIQIVPIPFCPVARPRPRCPSTLPVTVSAASGDSAVIEDPIRVIRIERNDDLKENVHAELGPAAPITFLTSKRKTPNPTSSIRASAPQASTPQGRERLKLLAACHQNWLGSPRVWAP